MNQNGWAISLTPQEPEESAVPRQSANSANSTPPWLTVSQATRYLGMSPPSGRAPTSVYQIAREIGYEVGGRWLIDRQELDEWIRKQRRGAVA